MSIRAKVVLLVLPLIVAPLLLTGFIASLSARNGITSVATSLLAFKMDALLNYANSQWSLLVENNFVGNREYVDAARTAVSSYAGTLVRSDSELIFALDADGKVAMSTSPLSLSADERAALSELAASRKTGWVEIQAGGTARVAQAGRFQPFGWYLLVTERRDTFYKATSEIFLRTGLILSVSLVIAIVLLVFFSVLMTQPLRMVASAMREIMRTNDLSRRVDILYRDETGELGHSFNLMTAELDKAYRQIKGYALEAAIAQHREQKVRTIFQKYVPESVINEFFAKPESMLVGQKRTLAILFSDIRSFTSISEGLTSAQIVESLNDYFAIMVEIIQDRHGGIVDKYIGDAIMAFFGAPVKHDDDAFHSVMSGFEMLDSIRGFNAAQVSKGRPPFRIGVGIKLRGRDAGQHRLREEDGLHDHRRPGEPCIPPGRPDKKVPGGDDRIRTGGPPAERADPLPMDRHRSREREAGGGPHLRAAPRPVTGRGAGLEDPRGGPAALYYRREFGASQDAFSEVLRILPEDSCAAMFIQRCRDHLKNPPPASWTGAFVMTEK